MKEVEKKVTVRSKELLSVSGSLGGLS